MKKLYSIIINEQTLFILSLLKKVCFLTYEIFKTIYIENKLT